MKNHVRKSKMEFEIEKRLDSKSWDMEIASRVFEKRRIRRNRLLIFSSGVAISALIAIMFFSSAKLFKGTTEQTVSTNNIQTVTNPNVSGNFVAMSFKKKTTNLPANLNLSSSDPFDEKLYDFNDVDLLIDETLSKR